MLILLRQFSSDLRVNISQSSTSRYCMVFLGINTLVESGSIGLTHLAYSNKETSTENISSTYHQKNNFQTKKISHLSEKPIYPKKDFL